MKGAHRLRVFLVIVTLAALVLAVMTIDVHVRLRLDPSYQSPLCHISKAINCSKVLQSKWAELFHVPLGSYGILFYGSVLFLVILNWGALGASGRVSAEVLLVLSFAAVLCSLFLFGVSRFVIGALCPLCLGMYALNLLMFIGVFFLDRVEAFGRRLVEGLRDILRWPLLVAGRESFDRTSTSIARGAVVALALLTAGAVSVPQMIETLRIAQFNDSVISQWEAEPQVQIPTTTGGVLGDYSIGDAHAPVSIVEFSDYECPMCRELYAALEFLLEEYKGKVYFSQRNFPIDNTCNDLVTFKAHHNACNAAMFARCAGEQGKFWEANKYLFTLEAFDRELGTEQVRSEIDRGVDILQLDRSAMAECLAAVRQRGKITADIHLADKLGLQGTPTLWINGKKIVGPSEEILRKILSRLLTAP